MGFIDSLFSNKKYFFKGMILYPSDANKMRKNGIYHPFLLYNRDDFTKKLQEEINEYKDKRGLRHIQLDVDKYGFRQISTILGGTIAGSFVGHYITPKFITALRYACADIKGGPEPRSGQRGYVFVIEVKKDEIFSERIEEYIPNKFKVFSSGGDSFWLDSIISHDRIVKVIDVGDISDLHGRSKEWLMMGFEDKYKEYMN